MAEEKKEKKKSGKIKRILKWIGLILLAILTTLAIVFQAPWKVITLLVIILLACTILPRAYRKWFWLSAGAVVIALIIWIFLPEDNEGWRPYTFDEELAALQAKYAVPDSENAAIIYNQLLEDYNEATFEPNFLDPDLEGLTRKEPWSSRDYPELAQWVKQHESTITKLIEASKVEKCRFPVVADMMALGERMEILAPMRRWAFLLSRAANNDLGENRIDQALEKQIALLQMGKHQCQQSTMIDFLVGVAIEVLATKQFNRFIVTGNPTEEHLNVIEKSLAHIKHDWSYDLPRILEGEKLLTKNFLGMFYTINPEGKIRLNPGIAIRSIMAQLPEDMKDEMVITYWHKKAMKASTILCWFYMPSSPQKVGEVIDRTYKQYYAMAEPDFDWQREHKEFDMSSLPKRRFNYRYLIEHLTGITFSAYYRIHELHLRLACDIQGARIMIALRRYKNQNGHWPESLNEIKSLTPAEIFIDPINGDSFVYKLTEENFTLYSKGKNNIDEDGQYNSKWDPNSYKEKVKEDDRLIWPPKLHKTQEEKTNDEQQ